MYNIEEYVLTYEYTCVFDLEGMPHMESSYGKNKIELKVGQFLNLPFYEDKKSFIKNIELQDELFVVTLSIPCKPLWENDGEEVEDGIVFNNRIMCINSGASANYGGVHIVVGIDAAGWQTFEIGG